MTATTFVAVALVVFAAEATAFVAEACHLCRRRLYRLGSRSSALAALATALATLPPPWPPWPPPGIAAALTTLATFVAAFIALAAFVAAAFTAALAALTTAALAAYRMAAAFFEQKAMRAAGDWNRNAVAALEFITGRARRRRCGNALAATHFIASWGSAGVGSGCNGDLAAHSHSGIRDGTG